MDALADNAVQNPNANLLKVVYTHSFFFVTIIPPLIIQEYSLPHTRQVASSGIRATYLHSLQLGHSEMTRGGGVLKSQGREETHTKH